jgi:hypothetical protein
MKPVEQNHYEFLEVDPSASPEEIRRAVQKLREVFGPDSLALYSLVDREEHKALLDRLEEAALVLTDERARAAYDERHGLGKKSAPAPAPVRAGPAEQLSLPEIVDAVDGAPAWPGAAAVEPAVGAPVAAPAPEAAEEATAPAVPEPVAPFEDPGATASGSAAPVDAPAARVAVPATAAPPPAAAAAPTSAAVSSRDTPAAGPGGDEDAAAEAGVAEDVSIDLDFDLDVDLEVDERPGTRAIQPARGPAARTTPAVPPPEVGPETEYTGELLRQLREARGLSLQDMAKRTRISTTHLENLENEAFRLLPERVYLRGFLTAYARELKLDAARLSETYLARWSSGRRS